jgi:hypothetical protein
MTWNYQIMDYFFHQGIPDVVIAAVVVVVFYDMMIMMIIIKLSILFEEKSSLRNLSTLYIYTI